MFGHRCFFHIDVNSAFLSWEAVYRLQHGESLDLREIPSAVGGSGSRESRGGKQTGIICAKSIPAKKYGIQTGESVVDALKKCPHLVVVPANHGLYKKSSKSMFELLGEYTDRIHIYSIDECFLDFSDRGLLYKDKIFEEEIKHVAIDIKERIKKEWGFTVSIGISDSKVLSKMASELKKPDAVSTLFTAEIQEKMWPLPVGELFMVGRATAKKLNKIGIKTIGDLAKTDVEVLERYLKSHGKLIHDFANGISSSTARREDIKSIGNSRTIGFLLDNAKEAKLILLALTEKVCMRLRQHHFQASTISVMYKNTNFEVQLHQQTSDYSTDQTMKIYKMICAIFDEIWQGDPIRSLGVRLSGLTKNSQMSLFHDADYKTIHTKAEMDRSMDELRQKYFGKILERGTFINSGIDSFSDEELDPFEEQLLFH